MKRSLFIVSAILIFAACNNNSDKDSSDAQNAMPDTTEVVKPTLGDSSGLETGSAEPADSVNSDTAKTIESEGQTKSQLEKKGEVQEAPKHGSSDADELERMKAEKNKKKK